MSSLRARFEQLSDEDYERAVRELAELAAELAEETNNPIPDEVVEIRNTPSGELRRPEQNSADSTREAASSEQPHDPDRKSQTQRVSAQGAKSEQPKRPRSKQTPPPKGGLVGTALQQRIQHFLFSEPLRAAVVRRAKVVDSTQRVDITISAIYPELLLAPRRTPRTWRIDDELKSLIGREVSVLVLSEKTHKPYVSAYKTWAPDHEGPEPVPVDNPEAARETARKATE